MSPHHCIVVGTRKEVPHQLLHALKKAIYLVFYEQIQPVTLLTVILRVGGEKGVGEGSEEGVSEEEG